MICGSIKIPLESIIEKPSNHHDSFFE